MFDRLRSNVLYILPSPLDKYVWTVIHVGIFHILNTFFRVGGDDEKTGFIETQYRNFYNFFNGNHLLIYCAGNVIVALVVYWIIGSAYIVLDVLQKPEIFTRYKIQPEKNSGLTNPSIWKCVRSVFVNQFIIIPFSIANFVVTSYFSPIDFNPRNVPTFLTLFFDMVVNSTLLEIGFYCSHRLMHQPYFYKKFHKKHHEYVAPIGISFFYTHPFEHLIGILIPFVLGQYIRPAHVTSAFFWIVISIYIGISEHSGYHFPILSSPEFHEYHHIRFNQNYGLVGLMDWIFGTSKEFSKSKARERHFCFYDSKPLKDVIPDDPKECKREVDTNCNSCN